MKKVGFVSLVSALCLSAFAQNSVNPVPQSADANSWWQKRFAQKHELVKAGGSKIVFIGDSITHFWEGNGKAQWEKYFAGEPYRALNLGYSADRTEHVLWRLDHGELDGYSPEVIILMIGTNNTGHHKIDDEPPMDTVIGIKAVLDKIRQKAPQARIILHPIFPRGEKPDDGFRVRNEIVNKEIRRFADDRSIVWCDFNDQLLTTDGILTAEMMKDRLHPGPVGYEIWAKSVIPVINRCLAEKLDPVAATPSPAMGWLGRMGEKRRQVLAKADRAFDVVAIGDSITHGWDSRDKAPVIQKYFSLYSFLNLGNSGERTQHVLWRVQNGALAGFKAKCIPLMIGTNNCRSDKPEEVALGIRKILDAIREKQPDAVILLNPIFPRGAKPDDPLRVANEKVNAIIKDYADGQKILWVDFNKDFLQEDGTLTKDIMPDYLHPCPKGSEIWAKAVLPYLKQVIGK
ncbi:MAG: hypothetical protein IJR99_06665 [Kiritimatiellae bacterium]|nr:hypothetical protein [Kiritimatiellia bacterium]